MVNRKKISQATREILKDDFIAYKSGGENGRSIYVVEDKRTNMPALYEALEEDAPAIFGLYACPEDVEAALSRIDPSKIKHLNMEEYRNVRRLRETLEEAGYKGKGIKLLKEFEAERSVLTERSSVYVREAAKELLSYLSAVPAAARYAATFLLPVLIYFALSGEPAMAQDQPKETPIPPPVAGEKEPGAGENQEAVPPKREENQGEKEVGDKPEGTGPEPPDLDDKELKKYTEKLKELQKGMKEAREEMERAEEARKNYLKGKLDVLKTKKQEIESEIKSYNKELNPEEEAKKKIEEEAKKAKHADGSIDIYVKSEKYIQAREKFSLGKEFWIEAEAGVRSDSPDHGDTFQGMLTLGLDKVILTGYGRGGRIGNKWLVVDPSSGLVTEYDGTRTGEVYGVKLLHNGEASDLLLEYRKLFNHTDADQTVRSASLTLDVNADVRNRAELFKVGLNQKLKDLFNTDFGVLLERFWNDEKVIVTNHTTGNIDKKPRETDTITLLGGMVSNFDYNMGQEFKGSTMVFSGIDMDNKVCYHQIGQGLEIPGGPNVIVLYRKGDPRPGESHIQEGFNLALQFGKKDGAMKDYMQRRAQEHLLAVENSILRPKDPFLLLDRRAIPSVEVEFYYNTGNKLEMDNKNVIAKIYGVGITVPVKGVSATLGIEHREFAEKYGIKNDTPIIFRLNIPF